MSLLITTKHYIVNFLILTPLICKFCIVTLLFFKKFWGHDPRKSTTEKLLFHARITLFFPDVMWLKCYSPVKIQRSSVIRLVQTPLIPVNFNSLHDNPLILLNKVKLSSRDNQYITALCPEWHGFGMNVYVYKLQLKWIKIIIMIYIIDEEHPSLQYINCADDALWCDN